MFGFLHSAVTTYNHSETVLKRLHALGGLFALVGVVRTVLFPQIPMGRATWTSFWCLHQTPLILEHVFHFYDVMSFPSASLLASLVTVKNVYGCLWFVCQHASLLS